MTVVLTMLMSDDEVAAYGRTPDAGFGALRTERGLLPLIAMEVDARVVGVIATIDVAQTFVNITPVALEATYIFPLPDRAAVHKFQMVVAGRVIDGVIDERGAARAEYDEAIAAGHRAAIAEEERAGVFTLRVGNLMPGEAAIVRLSLVGPLPVDDGEVTFRFPLVVAPRYIPGAWVGGAQTGLGTAADTDLVPDASRISPPVLLPGCHDPVRLGLRVALADGVVRDVTSSLHAVVVSSHDAQVVEVRPGERLDRDFILRWRIDGAELGSSLVCISDASGAGGTFALTIAPPSAISVAAKPRDVVFVIDRSGSMEGWKMVAARRAAARMIDTLTSRDRFSAIVFDDRAERLPATTLVEATDRHRFHAVEALAKVEARGGTEIDPALRLALRLLAGGTTDRERVIMLVTDGQVGNESQILRDVAPLLRNIKMFTLGIDKAVNASFLRQLAAAGGGLCELVESEDRLDAVMAKVHRRIGTPLATELALFATGLEIERDSLAPSKLPDVYAGAPVVVLGRFRGPVTAGATIAVKGTSLGDPLRMAVAAVIAPQATSWLAASWARARLRDLEDRYAARASGELEHQIVQLSKQFSVLSRFTAFLAVDRSQIANRSGRLQQVVQPVELPSGWDDAVEMGGLPARYAQAPAEGGIGSLPVQGRAGSGAPRAGGYGPPPMAEGSGGPMMPASSPASPPRPREAQPMPSFELPEPRRRLEVPASPPAGQRRAPGAYPPPPPPRSPAAASRPGPTSDGSPSDAAVDATAYLAQLWELAVELAAKGAADVVAIRLLRQRLGQWIEDARSVGLGDLTRAVEALVARLSAALVAQVDLGAEARVIAEALTKLAGSGPPRPDPQPRVAFWK